MVCNLIYKLIASVNLQTERLIRFGKPLRLHNIDREILTDFRCQVPCITTPGLLPIA